MGQKVDFWNIVLLRVVPGSNYYRVTGDLSRGNELANGFRDRPQRPEPLQKNILQSG